MSSTPKHVVSVGLGSSTRDAYIETELLGQRIVIERRGTDGDVSKAKQLLKDLRQKVDAFGLGGTDLYIQVAGRRYNLRESWDIAKSAGETPIVCGAGLKHTLERRVVQSLDNDLKWSTKKVLVVSAVDRFGMAESIAEHGANTIYGDMIFLLGLDIPFKKLEGLARVARVIAGAMTKLPIKYLYPTGSNQESTKTNNWRAKHFEAADVIAGDFHLIRRYAPKNLSGKIILTNTTTEQDVALLKTWGLKTLITTTPRIEGRSLSTNMLESAFVALSGKFPLTTADYEELIKAAELEPSVLELND